MTKAEEIFEKHIGLNAELGYTFMKKEDIINAINEALEIEQKYHDERKVAEYWHKRCQLAEKFINESPSDPDITDEQAKSFQAWKEFIK